MSDSWRVVYPNGERDKLSIAQVYDYEESDWDIASRRLFGGEAEAYEYMIELAKKNGLTYNRRRGFQTYLD